MRTYKSTKKKPEKVSKPLRPHEGDVCFVISPIGKTGSEEYKKFKEALDYVVKPAVENSGYRLKVVRADDIERAGSFIKDILQNLVDSFVVIADLTGKNPNVFYELGVRHSLSPRTILIAQSLEDIPSDLREYRTIIYDMSAKGAAAFQARLTKYLEEIYAEPDRPDSPVQDRLGSILEQNKAVLENENIELRKQLESILRKGTRITESAREERARTRAERIIELIGAERQALRRFYGGGEFTRKEGEETKKYSFPIDQGHFELYFVKEGGAIKDFVYFALVEDNVAWDRDLADIRVLMEKCSQGQDTACKFIIVTNINASGQKKRILKAFEKMKTFIKQDQRELFELEIWDKAGLLKKEKQLGIKVDV